MDAIVRVHNSHYFIYHRLHAVIVLIPDYNDSVAAAGPHWRSVDCCHQFLHLLVAENNQSWVQTTLRAIVIRVVVAERGAVAASVLVITLAGRNEREISHTARSEFTPQSACIIERRHIGIAVQRISAFLYRLEISERIVLNGIQLHNFAAIERRIQNWFDFAEIREVREISVAVIHIIRPAQWQILLIGLPSLSHTDKLIRYGDAERCRNCRVRYSPIHIDFARRARHFIRAIQSWSGRVSSTSSNGTNSWAGRIARVWDSGREISCAGGAVPHGIVVAMHTEV